MGTVRHPYGILFVVYTYLTDLVCLVTYIHTSEESITRVDMKVCTYVCSYEVSCCSVATILSHDTHNLTILLYERQQIVGGSCFILVRWKMHCLF